MLSWPVFGLTLGALIAGSGAAQAAGPVLPTGGRVAAGQAVIGAPGGRVLTITQSSSKAILDWSGFSIGAGGKVAFDNGSGATLNRVTGQGVSSLDGLLTGTGSVYLINPNGVIVGRGGVVKVGGSFVASTLDTSDSGFLAGGPLSFAGPSTASVVNLGKVGALGGDVALIAAKVSNAGSLSAPQGSAGLIAGHSVLMLRDGALDQGRFSVLLGGPGTSVTNTGLIQAADAELRAEGGNVYALAGDTSGVIRATGVKRGGGKVWLVAQGGELDLGGAIDAQGAGGTAGSVETSGGTVKIGSARIDAHGGRWLVDPDDLTIDATAASTIDNALNAGTSVTEQTTASGTSGAGVVNTAGAGDIIVAAPISWNTGAELTLSAYRDIYVNAQVTASGGGALTLITDNNTMGNGGTPYFNAPVQFTAVTPTGQPVGALRIGVGDAATTSYTLVADLATLSADIAANTSGDYALATSVDGGNGYTGVPLASTVATPFAGTLEGLGNSVQNLVINDASDAYVGLFSQVGPTGIVRNVNIRNTAVRQSSYSSQGEYAVGGLAGANYGSIYNIQFQGYVAGSDLAGGLVGDNKGFISGSFVNGSVNSINITGGVIGSNYGQARGIFFNGSLYGGTYAGGLVGFSAGASGKSASIEGGVAGNVYGNSYVGGLAGFNGKSSTLTGYVNDGVSVRGAGDVGGAAGYNIGTVTGATSLAYVDGQAGQQGQSGATGGLVGFNDVAGVIFGSSTNGLVDGASSSVGGLVGLNAGQVGGQSLAANFTTGVTQTGSQNTSVGGLVGQNTGTVVNGYASGLVNAPGAAGASVGGLVGRNTGSVAYAYALGEVSTSNSALGGGLVGNNTGAISQAYATGYVHGGSGKLGGVAGVNSGTLNAVYYDQGTTQQSQAVAVDSGATTAVAMGTGSGADRYSQATYGAFNFGAGGWFMVEGATRPILQAEASSQVSNAHQLELVALNPVGYYVQTNNIEFYDALGLLSVFNPMTGFAPIGSGGKAPTAFKGFYDGGDYFISDLTINNTGTSVGLFALNAGTIQNLHLDGLEVSGGAAASAYGVGGVAGENDGMLQNVSYDGSVRGTERVGGLVGTNKGTIAASYGGGSVSGADTVGGLVGYNIGVIVRSEGSAMVAGTSSSSYGIGGVAGVNGGVMDRDSADFTPSLSEDQNTLGVSGDHQVGGLVGFNVGPISNSYASSSVGGGSGKSAGTTQAAIGGLVGQNIGQLTGDMASGSVTGMTQVGGLIGYNNGAVIDTYATGAVSGASGKGALVGVNDTYGSIQTSWASGRAVFGFAGVNNGTFTQDYFDTASTGTTTGVGSGPSAGVTAIGGSTGLDPHQASSYTGFDFTNTWTIQAGASRPYLLAVPQSPPPT